MSLYNAILTGVKDVITNLNLSYNNVSVPLEIRKLPKAEQNIDNLPIIAITPSTNPFNWALACFPNSQEFVDYKVQITIIAGGNLDFTSNIDTYNDWYEAIRKAFRNPQLMRYQVAEIWTTRVNPGVEFDRYEFNNLYDYLTMELVLTSIENP